MLQLSMVKAVYVVAIVTVALTSTSINPVVQAMAFKTRKQRFTLCIWFGFMYFPSCRRPYVLYILDGSVQNVQNK